MKTILALQPESRRIGYAVFEGPTLVDWGSKDLESEGLRDRISRLAIPFFQKVITKYKPDVIVLPTPTKTFRAARNRFLRAIRFELARQPHNMSSYSRHDIQQRFKFVLRSKRPNKHLIMQILVKRFPELATSIPGPRRPWESEDYWTPMFDAVALAATYLYHNE